MSDNIPPAASGRSQRRGRKSDKARLPTPPPDPRADDDFFAYLDSLQKEQCARSAFGPVLATENAFDHLEKLYKLMEQMLELREQNARLHRKVRELEHLSNLERVHKLLQEECTEQMCPDLDRNAAYAEAVLESILADSKPTRPSTTSRIRQSIYRKHRNRSGSVSDERSPGLEEAGRRASVCAGDGMGKAAKVSKWTKVKAAFKWERAAPNVSDTKSQDSGFGGMMPVNLEVAKYLRVPSTCEDNTSGNSPSADSGAAGISTPGSLSTASSNDDFHHHNHQHHHRTHQELRSEELRSSDDEHPHTYITHSKEGSQKSNKSHKTPWAKMKDIIQTRNSFKKKHRLSGHSDDIQIDVELCTDNEEVFEDADKNKLTTISHIYNRSDTTQVPPEIVTRYQQVVDEDRNIVDDFRPVSKWTRVKKAFLPPLDLSSPQLDENKLIQEEIQINYQQLQKKLSLDFQEKLNEWERMKQNSPGVSTPSAQWQKNKAQSSTKNQQIIQIMNEENLPPEFRKKLQEWKEIRKSSGKESSNKKELADTPRWKTASSPKSDNSPVFEYPKLSDDFRKKFKKWKQKSGGASPQAEDNEKTKNVKLSPRLTRKNSSPKHGKKHKDMHEKELQWFEKELGKIEKEKQRLERERERFLEREETLSKLRSSVVGCLKKDVLIHTPSGFHRFEGISRKFTQKLYEWEKAQGIGPESSTFALLNSSLTKEQSIQNQFPRNTPSLTRSKSADSVAIAAINLQCPLLRSQPSSLSLNDVEELEKECLTESKSSSMQFIEHEVECDDEPEALIVEVEDIIEETAAPLRTYEQRIQQPIYQREELKALCEGETLMGPKVRRSESARAQNNYNIIEEIFNIIRNLLETELEIQKTQSLLIEQLPNKNAKLIQLKTFEESQKACVERLMTKILRLQEANSDVFANLNNEDHKSTLKQVQEMLEVVQDLSSEIYQLSEKLEIKLSNRSIYESTYQLIGACGSNSVVDITIEIRKKMLELRRHLSYICAVSDSTAPKRKCSSRIKKTATKTLSNESTKSELSSDVYSTESNKVPKERLYIRNENTNLQSQGAVKKRIKYRQKSQHKNSDTDTEEEISNDEMKRNTHKKIFRTRTVSEEHTKATKVEIVVDESIIKKVVVPTQTNYVTLDQETSTKPTDSPVTVFVKTTRKLFTPFIESNINMPKPKIQVVTEPSKPSNKEESKNEENHPVVHLPPLPASPTPSRKVSKDISPSIRLMLAKYHQKVSEQDSPSGKSGGSSGSNSPVAWRSPAAERRVKAQTERYQEGLNKLSPLLGGRREVQKSASLGGFHKKQVTVPEEFATKTLSEKNICKSISATVIPSLNDVKEVDEDNAKSANMSELRLKKLQKAKEEFLTSAPPSAPIEVPPIKFPARNRLSQISVDSSESGYEAFSGALMKSASAGMINVDAEIYRQFDPEMHGGGYVSLPRSIKQPKSSLLSGKFAFSNIASKFRKVKMRRGQNKDKGMNTVSTLCRQSLVVDPFVKEIKGHKSKDVSSEDVSSTSSQTGSWIRKTNLFKK